MKNIKLIITKQLLGAAIAATALIVPAIASAQDASAYTNGTANQQIRGTVSAINSTWNITVNDSSGYSDNIALHQGTIINPTGLALEPGMSVTIDGYADGSNFDAMEIDTPYQYSGPPPVAVYYGPGAWYPGYVEGWGPSFSLAYNVNSRRFEQRSFSFDGQIRRALTPPAAPARTAYNAPQQLRSFGPPPQQARNFAAPPQQSRSFAAPPQQQARFSAPVARAGGNSAPRGGPENHRGR